MTAQELFLSKGYAVSDNRSQNWKNINKAMQNGVEINLAKNGYFFSKKEKNVRMSLRYNGLATHFELPDFVNHGNDSDVVGDSVVNAIASFLKAIRKRDGIVPNIGGKCTCGKCGGSGFIRQFSYYCGGVCFDCMGIGYK